MMITEQTIKNFNIQNESKALNTDPVYQPFPAFGKAAAGQACAKIVAARNQHFIHEPELEEGEHEPEPEEYHHEHYNEQTKPIRDNEEHYHCERFKVEGRAPPFPPVGGQIYMNKDGVTESILTKGQTNKNLLDNCSNFYKCCSDDEHHDHHQGQKTAIDEPQMNIENNSTAPGNESQEEEKYPPTNYYNDQTHTEFDQKQYQNYFFAQSENEDEVPTFKDHNKRTNKAYEKENTKLTCKGCFIRYNKIKTMGFCHNCYKIFEAVEQFVKKHNGFFVFIEDKNQFELMCIRNHHWVVDFKTKQVKKWCKACKKSERILRKEYFKQIDEEKQREFEKMQQKLFEEAKFTSQGANNGYGVGQNDNSYTFGYRNTQTAGGFNNNRVGFLQYLLVENGDERIITAKMMEDVVNFILNEPIERLEEFFLQFPKEKRMRVFRRLARMTHPDKNNHKLAKEAFQKLLSSSWRRCSLRNLIGFKVYFEDGVFNCHA